MNVLRAYHRVLLRRPVATNAITSGNNSAWNSGGCDDDDDLGRVFD